MISYNKKYISYIVFGFIFSIFLSIISVNTSWAQPEGKKVELVSDKSIDIVIVDKNDVVWTGTRSSGISRFDGETWTVFTSKNGLPADGISAMAAGPDGKVWVCTGTYTDMGYFLGHGLSCFDGTEWTTYTTEDGLLTNSVSALAIGPDGTIWIQNSEIVATPDGPSVLYKGISSLTDNVWTAEFRIGTGVTMCVDSNGLVYSGNRSIGVFVYDGFELTDISDPKSENAIEQLVAYDDIIYNLQFGGVSRYKDGKWESLQCIGCGWYPSPLERITVDPNGVLWGCGRISVYNYEYHVWSHFGVGINEPDLRSLAFDSQGNLWVGSHTGLYKISDDIPVFVESNNNPDQIEITGNFPNPFNSSTTIDFTLQSPEIVTLSIFDISGRKVSQLVSGLYNEGIHSVIWNGKDDSGNIVSSGVYFSRLENMKSTVTHRMIFLK